MRHGTKGPLTAEEPFGDLARHLVATLLEAKDAAVRALVAR